MRMLLLGLIALPMMSACVPGQATEVARYRELLDEGDSGAALPLPDEPLTLQQALLLSNRANERVAIEGEDYLQSLIERRRVAGRFFPTLSFAPSYFAREGSGGQGEGEIVRTTALNGTDLPVNVELTISPIRDASDALAADEFVEQREATLREVQDGLLLDVAQAYYEAVRADKQVEVLNSSLALQEARLTDVMARNEIGLARVLDVELTKSQRAQTRIELLEAITNSRTSRSLLVYLTAWRGAGESRLQDTLLVPASVPELQGAMAEATRSRYDLRAAQAAIRVAEHRVRSAYGEYFPSVSANLSYFFSRDSEPTDRSWNSLIEVSLPLFSAGVIEANVRDALSELRKAKLRYSMKRREVQRDVEVARENLIAAHQRQSETRIRLEAAESALTVANSMYDVGMATNLERLTAQDQFQSTRLQVTNAELETKLAYLNFLRGLGLLHPVAGLTRATLPAAGDEDA